jgi:hypothetical protein
MSYEVAPIDIVSKERVIDPRAKKKSPEGSLYNWWEAQTDDDLLTQFLGTVEYLKRTNQQRIRQASIFARLYCGKPLYNYLASNATLDSANQLPIGRPTANVCYSCSDTLVSRITQDKPKPTFLTDGGNYKERKLAKHANQFIQGEFFRTKLYDIKALQVRDALVLGDGFTKIFPKDSKICAERTVATELLVDFNDGYYGKPRSLIHHKLVDRSVYLKMFPKKEQEIMEAVHGNVDSTPRSTDTIADQFIMAEGWHLPSSPDAGDGRHVIACSAGIIDDDEWVEDDFPFDKISYNPNVVGYFSQGLCEILMPTQMEIYRMLIIASQAIELMGVPRIYIDELSNIMETSFNNRIGTIIKGRGTPPEFLNATANNPEIYQWIQWLIQNAYQMSGMSQLAASGVKPPGLNSGESQRVFLETQDVRFAAFQRRVQDSYTQAAYKFVDCAEQISDDLKDKDGKGDSYKTVYAGKDGTKEISFDDIKELNDTYVIQCFEESALPKDPAGRQAKLSEMRADGEITPQEFRRLSNFPDLEQDDRLAFALEERILMCLDDIIDNGAKNYAKIQPDVFMLDPSDIATTKCVQYINLYSQQKLEADKMDLLRNWFTQVQDLKQKAMPPQPVQPQAMQQQGASQLPPAAPPNAPIAPTSGVQV